VGWEPGTTSRVWHFAPDPCQHPRATGGYGARTKTGEGAPQQPTPRGGALPETTPHPQHEVGREQGKWMGHPRRQAPRSVVQETHTARRKFKRARADRTPHAFGAPRRGRRCEPRRSWRARRAGGQKLWAPCHRSGAQAREHRGQRNPRGPRGCPPRPGTRSRNRTTCTGGIRRAVIGGSGVYMPTAWQYVGRPGSRYAGVHVLIREASPGRTDNDHRFGASVHMTDVGFIRRDMASAH